MGLLIPEVVIHNTLHSLVEELRNNFEEQSDEKLSMLYTLVGEHDDGSPIEIDGFNYYTAAKEIFLRGTDNQRKLTINMGYNLQRAGVPTIHIMLPSEQPKNEGLGTNEGYYKNSVQQEPKPGEYREFKTTSYGATYNLMISSENSQEVTLIYNIIRGCMVSLIDHLELNGLRNCHFSGQDMMLQNELTPENIFHRILGVIFWYEIDVPNLFSQKPPTDLDFIQHVQ